MPYIAQAPIPAAGDYFGGALLTLSSLIVLQPLDS
jgi:hypothetical protein